MLAQTVSQEGTREGAVAGAKIGTLSGASKAAEMRKNGDTWGEAREVARVETQVGDRGEAW